MTKKPTALDPIWLNHSSGDELIDLRRHVIRLCFVADELQVRSGDNRWTAVTENLHLAASLRNLQADTDLTGTNYMCSAAADHDEALSILTERHLAGIIVFNLCWSAYEGAVELAAGGYQGRRPKGALGRDLLRDQYGDGHFPWLRQCLWASIDFVKPSALASPEAKKMIRESMFAALAAELLRSFRNDVAHGTLTRPYPADWGEQTEYNINGEPAILMFHHHVRLLLLLIQIMILQANTAMIELSQLTEDFASTKDILLLIHSAERKDYIKNEQLELDLGTSKISFNMI